MTREPHHYSEAMDDATLMTAADLEALHAELAQLEGEGRRDIASRIKTAREWGDLKENSEYHDAKNEQAHLETRIAMLRDRLARAQVVEVAEDGGPNGVVAFGSVVTVRDEQGRERTGPVDDDPDEFRARLSRRRRPAPRHQSGQRSDWATGSALASAASGQRRLCQAPPVGLLARPGSASRAS